MVKIRQIRRDCQIYNRNEILFESYDVYCILYMVYLQKDEVGVSDPISPKFMAPIYQGI